MADRAVDTLSKVPAVTFAFWVIKILATTLGETGGDAVSMTWLGETTPDAASSGVNGYLIGTAIFGAVLFALVWLQIRARRFDPWLYWATIIASTTAGTTLADFATRSIGLGYPGGSLLLFSLVVVSLLSWHRALGTVDVNRIDSARARRLSTGSQSHSRKHSAPRWATGSLMARSVTQARLWYSAALLPSSQRSIF